MVVVVVVLVVLALVLMLVGTVAASLPPYVFGRGGVENVVGSGDEWRLCYFC